MLRPRSVSAIHVDGAKVDDEVVHGVHDYLTVYTIISIASLLLIAIDNFSMETSLTAVLACLNNIGPGLDLVGPMGNYACFSAGSKLILSLDMLIGRLEIFPMLMLAVPLPGNADRYTGGTALEEKTMVCPCKKKNCPRHGNCGECKEFHRINSKYPPYCAQKGKKKRSDGIHPKIAGNP